ncbi:hypothetical protein ADH74_20405, partial [Bacteroides caecimuris]
WDIISVEKTLFSSAERRGMRRGLEEGMKKGLEEGKKEGIKEGKKEVARSLKMAGIPTAIIMESTGLLENEIEDL